MSAAWDDSDIGAGFSQAGHYGKTLVLVADIYPFGRGEEFLEDEVPFLAKQFDHVLIISVRADSSMPQSRSLPTNVQAIAGLEASVNSSRVPNEFASLLCALRQFRFSDVRRVLDGASTPLAVLSSLLFEFSARNVYQNVLKSPIYQKIQWTQSVVVYGYWLHVAARVGELVHESVKANDVVAHTRFVSRAHGYDLYSERSRSGQLPQREHLLRALDSVMFVSEHGLRYMRRNFPLHAAKYSVRRLGTRPPYPSSAVSRCVLGITTCSSIIPLKRLELVPQVLFRLIESGLSPRWTHIGDGPGRQALERIVELYGLEDVVDFVGHVPHEELFSRLSRIPTTLFLNLSSTEGAPVSLMEAISQGIPVVATDVGGSREIVFNYETGRLVSPEARVDDVAEAICWIWNLDSRAFEAMRAACRDRWRREFDGEYNFSAFAESLVRCGGLG